MFMRMMYDDRLAQAAYLIGCQRTGQAIVIDPERDVDRYIAAAAAEGLRIVAAAETHIHADFLSGVRELAERTGCRVYLSGEGGPDWSYRWLNQRSGGREYDHVLLKDGDTFSIGLIEFRVMHTPGHTPEHISFVVTDRGAGATEPMAIATGDFVFVGDLGRPDLLETAAGSVGAKDPAARTLFRSTKRFDELPEYVQVWPGHGAGSACGKALGAIPQSTVGYEKRFNPAIRAARDEEGFVSFILSGQPEPPLYFARMKRENRDGVPLLPGLPRPRRMSGADLARVDGRKTVIVDTRPWEHFRMGHAAGAISAPFDKSFVSIVGSYVEPEDEIVLLIDADEVEEAVRALVRIGLDQVVGVVSPEEMAAFAEAGGQVERTEEMDVVAAAERLGADGDFFLDVRRADEFEGGHVPGAMNVAHTRIAERVGELPRDKRLIVNCQGGVRSARAVSYLQRQGFDVVNVKGGFGAWRAAGQPEETPSAVS